MDDQSSSDTQTSPINTRASGENTWHFAYVISLLSAIAGLFHDFGKANQLFQKKLKSQKILSEPYRHEWVSLRLFQAFVGESSDEEWLQALASVDDSTELQVLGRLVKDKPEKSPNPFANLPPLAQVVGWLIVSHHKLPRFHQPEKVKLSLPPPSRMDLWLKQMLSARWNSPQCDNGWTAKDFEAVWTFEKGTPLQSRHWRQKAKSLAERALQHPTLFTHNWLQDRFTSHMARLCLMLADHIYSAADPSPNWQDKRYKAYANTDRDTRKLKQKLDEHNVGVGHNAYRFARALPQIHKTLPVITSHKAIRKRSRDPQYRWQDKAYELATGIRERTRVQGFFGVNMASTGKGKTFANARIMVGLSDEKLGCRFNVALGLRTLTLQTGDALRERLQLHEDDLAVLIGSRAVRELHDRGKRKAAEKRDADKKLTADESGSESAEPLLEDIPYIRYEGALDDGRLSGWLQKTPKLLQLVSAPVVVSTIDHLMPATDGERGGKQIAPMLRLLTSDLVLDEPDDFGLEDLPALARLVNWAGMLGSRVLLSSATLPPALITALFDAYQAGRQVYANACGEPGLQHNVCCAWFDEFNCEHSQHAQPDSFQQAHQAFVQSRITKLYDNPVLRKVALYPVESKSHSPKDVADAMAKTLHSLVDCLHQQHHQWHQQTGKRVSIGLIRMANINPMVAVAQQLLKMPAPENCRIHFCVYHSQHPLIVRSTIEAHLDAALDRHQPDALWQVPAVHNAIHNHSETHHIFLVLGTAVTEVGRDHDYDWAIVEPSSMRSLIQLAGRIQRHRQQPPEAPNMIVLNKNIKAMRGETLAFWRPGFESKDVQLNSKDLFEVLEETQFQHISAAPRIQPLQPLQPTSNLADLEHFQLQACMYGADILEYYASLWWQGEVTWSAELQHRMKFRESEPEEEFVLLSEEENEPLLFHRFSERGEPLAAEVEFFQREAFKSGARVQPWVNCDAKMLLLALAEEQDRELADTCLTFARVGLQKSKSGKPVTQWLYHPCFGVFQKFQSEE